MVEVKYATTYMANGISIAFVAAYWEFWVPRLVDQNLIVDGGGERCSCAFAFCVIQIYTGAVSQKTHAVCLGTVVASKLRSEASISKDALRFFVLMLCRAIELVAFLIECKIRNKNGGT